MLGLSPNASRLSVRYWFTERLDEFAKRLAQHYDDLNIEPTPWKTPPAAWRLLASIAAQEKTENVPPQVAGSLMRAILSGGRYPRTLLSAAITRIRADGQITGLRVALCKAVLTRNLRLDNKVNQQEVPVNLDTSNTETGYLLGRLFSVLENIQSIALGNVNASITDRYYASASAVPQQVFYLLLKGAKNHISRARKTSDKNLIYSLESKMGEIIGALDGNFPKALSAEEQSWFAIGYYHQRYAHHGSKTSKHEVADITDETLELTE